MPRSALFRNSHPEAGQSSKSHQSSKRLLLCLSIPVTDSRHLGRKESFISTPPHPIHPPSRSPSHPLPHPSILHPIPHPISSAVCHNTDLVVIITSTPVPIVKMCTGNRFSFGPQCTLLCKTQSKRSPRTGLRQTEGTTNLYRLRPLLAFASVTELWTKRNSQELPRNSISCLPTVCAGLSPCKIIKYTLVSYLVLGLELLPQGRL